MRALPRLVSLLAFALARSAAAVDVTTCGQSVGPGDTGILQVDLDCTGQPGVCLHPNGSEGEVSCTSDVTCNAVLDPCVNAAVLLGAGAALQLNGRTITGAGVLCSAAGTCTVTGPGSIVSAPVGILARKKLVATGLTIDGGRFGIVSGPSGALLDQVNLTDHSEDGIWSWEGTVRATNVVATGNGGTGIYAKLKAVIAKSCTSSGNGNHGIDGYPVRAVALNVQGNGGMGIVSAKTLSVRDSTVTGNGVAFEGADVASARRPRVRNTTCDYSRDIGAGANNWGVCAAD
jgi:hypothetical protein